MNRKTKSFLSNFSYTIVSNLIALIISTLVILIVPKIIGVEEYGYWQLYLFYSAYIGFLHLGWNDGIYLRYGGEEYKNLNRNLFSSQFYMLIVFQLIISSGLLSVALIFLEDQKRIFIFEMISVCLLIINVRFMLLYVLQATNRIKEHAKIIMIDRVLYIILILYCIFSGIEDFEVLIIADVVGKFAGLLVAIYYCKNIVFNKFSNLYIDFKETILNIDAGIKLMFANIASMLIIGTVRFGIERSWDVSTFGKVSLIFSISSFMMIFINAIGLIIFPILRRMNKEKLPSIYITIRDVLMVLLFAVLMIYYPFKIIISYWLPEYEESLIYMGLLFPIFVSEGKMALLINTYLKTLRKEKQMLIVNLISLFASIGVTYITTVLLRDLELTVLSITLLLIFRTILAEILLSKKLKVSVLKNISFELMLVMIFILSSWFIDSWMSTVVYTFAYLLYLFLKAKDINKSILRLKLLMK